MTAGCLQRHVAIIPQGRFLLCRSTLWHSPPPQRRAQSTSAAKAAPATGTAAVAPSTGSTAFTAAAISSSNYNEIPAGCFDESATFPEPCLQRRKAAQKTEVVDLATTRPATLDSPPSLQRRDYADGNIPVGDRVKYLFRLGKSYLLFYKTGLKNVWNNSKRYRSMRQIFNGVSLNNIAKYGGEIVEARQIPQISRSAYQLCLRTRHDIFKMIPFSLVFLICGEFTPLVIIALGSSIVPYTCRIPQQEKKDLDNKMQQDRRYMENLPRQVSELESPLEAPDWRVEHLEAYRLGLSSIRTPIPILGPVVHALITRPRLIRHCDNIVSDTLLIYREGGLSKLSARDIYEWADAYGLYALRLYVERCQKQELEIVNEKMRVELLPKVDAEMRYMLELATRWSRLKPAEQWRIGLRTVGSQSPDWKARVNDMRARWTQA